MKPRKTEPRNPRVDLVNDHRCITDLLERVVFCARGDDRTGACTAWDALEVALLAHLNAEEMFVLPLLDKHDRAESDEIRREHAEIRREIGEIGIAFDLHLARFEALESFARRLEAHAKREDAIAYPHAERELEAHAAHSLFARLRGLPKLAREIVGSNDQPPAPRVDAK